MAHVQHANLQNVQKCVFLQKDVGVNGLKGNSFRNNSTSTTFLVYQQWSGCF